METDLLPDNILQENFESRNKLVPLWIRVFCWLFILSALLVPVGLVFGVLGYDFALALYGFETTEPFSAIGISLMLVFLLKGIVAYGILTQKEWAVKLALVDSIAGILICVFSMIFVSLVIRLELLALIPYFLKMSRIRSAWEAGMV